MESATRAELDAAGRTNTAAGRKAIALARLIDDPPPMTYSSVAGWSREHGAAMVAALAGATTVGVSALDELKARRRAKRGA